MSRQKMVERKYKECEEYTDFINEVKAKEYLKNGKVVPPRKSELSHKTKLFIKRIYRNPGKSYPELLTELGYVVKKSSCPSKSQEEVQEEKRREKKRRQLEEEYRQELLLQEKAKKKEVAIKECKNCPWYSSEGFCPWIQCQKGIESYKR